MGGVDSSFSTHASRYDGWYETPMGRALLATELACLRPLLQPFPRPYLEVGVGSGRFAEALGIEHGVDPSARALERAARRRIRAVLGIGECLPFKDTSFGAVLLVFTLCFVRDPDMVIREIHRVLFPGGGMILGVLLKGTPWADFYADRGRQGDPFFRTARFLSREEVDTALGGNSLRVIASHSTLFQPPGLEVYREEEPVAGCVPGAGFVALAAVKPDVGER
jgi:SAM-dependent methyltransferase